MEKPKNTENIPIHAIAAIQKKDRGIGYEDKLLFHIKEDLERFNEITRGQVIVLGRKTLESMQKYNVDFDERWNTAVILSSNENNIDEIPQNGVVANDIKDALEKARTAAQSTDKEVFVIGGGRVYEDALPHVNKLHLTVVEGDKPSDAVFPSYEETFEVVEEIKNEHQTKDGDVVPFSYVTLERRDENEE
jgi:dihydrofolate reductase